MAVKVRKYKRGGWEVDIIVRLADGKTVRERKKAPVPSKSGAMRWGQERERACGRGDGKEGPLSAAHFASEHGVAECRVLKNRPLFSERIPRGNTFQ